MARDDTPYAGGDPINYLKYAREMRNFYAAHVREPMFPAVTRIGLMLSGDADVGVSVASITFGLLALVATYVLGASVASPAVGLAAAAMLAIDHSAVYWAIGGWRDELLRSSPGRVHGHGCGSRGTLHARMPARRRA